MSLITTFMKVDVFITRFFSEDNLIFEQEAKFPLPTLSVNDKIDVFGVEYIVAERMFGLSEDAFMSIYYLSLKN